MASGLTIPGEASEHVIPAGARWATWLWGLGSAVGLQVAATKGWVDAVPIDGFPAMLTIPAFVLVIAGPALLLWHGAPGRLRPFLPVRTALRWDAAGIALRTGQFVSWSQVESVGIVIRSGEPVLSICTNLKPFRSITLPCRLMIRRQTCLDALAAIVAQHRHERLEQAHAEQNATCKASLAAMMSRPASDLREEGLTPPTSYEAALRKAYKLG